MMEWKRISINSDTPEGEPHVRGMWVFTAYGNGPATPSYFCANAGYVDNEGEFVSMDGDQDFGWGADDYEWWCPLPLPLPEKPRREDDQ